MNKLLITGCLLATAFAAVAMPNKKDLAAAQKRIEDVIAPDVKALNARRKTVKDVADVQMKLASDAQSEAEKYLLLQSAFKLYSRGEEFDSAAKALTAITRDIKDVPSELIAELVDKEFNRGMGLKAPKEIEAAERAAQRQRIMAMRKRPRNARADQRQMTVGGYTWSYNVKNGEAEIVSPTGKLYERAVSPCPTGDVVIPSGLDGKPVTGIGKFALCNCPGVTSVKISESVKCIGEWAFSGCSTLTAVTLPLSLTNIEECVFASCPNLLTIGLDAGNPVYKVVDGVLYTKDMKRLVTGLGGLTSVAIPSGVVDIGDHAFRCCRKLKSVTIPMSVKCIGRDAFCATALKSIAIPSSVESIGDQAFWCCSGLNSATMSEGMRSIGRMAFYQCRGLESVTIPASVKNIAYEAFYDCGKLTSVTMRGEKPDSGDKVFDKCPKLKFIHVPANAKSWAGMKEWQGIPLVFDAK